MLLSACGAAQASQPSAEDDPAAAAQETAATEDTPSHEEPTLESLLGEDYVQYLTETITMQMGNRMEKNPDVRYYPIEDNAPLSDYVTIDETTEFEVDEEGNPVILFPAGTVTDEAHGEQSFRIPKLYSWGRNGSRCGRGGKRDPAGPMTWPQEKTGLRCIVATQAGLCLSFFEGH